MITSKFRYCYLPSVAYCIPVGPFFVRQAGKYSVEKKKSSARESFDRGKPRNRWPGAKSIWELIRDDCGRRGAIHEIAGSFVRSLPPFPLSFLSSFFGRFSPPSTTSSSSSSCRDKFPREDAPLCADSRCPARLSEDWNRVKNCQSTGRRFEDRIWLSNFDNCYSWKDKKKRKKKL